MRTLAFTVAITVAGGNLMAQNPDQAPNLYRDHIQPLFKKSCLGCHNAGAKQGGLDLSTREALLRGVVALYEKDANNISRVLDVCQVRLFWQSKGHRLLVQSIVLDVCQACLFKAISAADCLHRAQLSSPRYGWDFTALA